MIRKNAMKPRVGSWLPADKSKLKEWVNKQIEELVSSAKAQNGEYIIHNPAVKELQDLIEKDVDIFVLTNQMIAQALDYDKYDPTGSPEITDYKMMLSLIDQIMTKAPEYIPPNEEGHSLIGFPINAILDWCMGTPAGYAFFLNEKVNQCFYAILSSWSEFLSSGDSVYVLNKGENGWMSEAAQNELHIEQFQYDPADEHWGFHSWNDFFIRKFKEGVRPIAEPDNPKTIISACESSPYRISKNIQENQQFWLKGQPYSVERMLNNKEYADTFVGGTIYQAFLSATKYHRWHSPIDGTIVDAYLIPGTYYSEIQAYPYDDAGPNNSQGYITQVAARAVIMIESDNPTIGLMGFVAVGMAEVSSCLMKKSDGEDLKKGDHVKKGDQIGYFQFGGSTHCLIFKKDVIEQFVLDAIPAEDFNNSSIIKVNSKLATTH